jgi:hypothetical protein
MHISQQKESVLEPQNSEPKLGISKIVPANMLLKIYTEVKSHHVLSSMDPLPQIHLIRTPQAPLSRHSDRSRARAKVTLSGNDLVVVGTKLHAQLSPSVKVRLGRDGSTGALGVADGPAQHISLNSFMR